MSSIVTASSGSTSAGRHVMMMPGSQTSGRSQERSPKSTSFARTPPGGRMGADVSTSDSSDKLTPMPDYMHPVTKSASRRWKKLHEDHMMGKLMDKRTKKKEKHQATKEEVKKIMRKIPMEVLAKEWMSDNKVTIETRAFLLDKILPTLVLGTEKLLVEVDKKGLADDTVLDPSFNPINFLAQYLMRNNPKYSNFSEASPYIRGLREISENLKEQLFDLDGGNRLAKIKAEARRKREEREQLEMLRHLEKQRRDETLAKQFHDWQPGLSDGGRLEMALIQNALRSYSEVIEALSEPAFKQAQLSKPMEPTDDTGKMLSSKEYIQFMTTYTEDLTSAAFDEFISHIDKCSLAYRGKAECEQRRVLLSQLFLSCDHTGVGLLDRHRILNLFEMFYDKATDTIKYVLRNPRKWPVVEVDEVVDDDSDDEEQDPRFINDKTDVTADVKAANKKGKSDPAENTDISKEDAGEDGPSVGITPEGATSPSPPTDGVDPEDSPTDAGETRITENSVETSKSELTKSEGDTDKETDETVTMETKDEDNKEAEEGTIAAKEDGKQSKDDEKVVEGETKDEEKKVDEEKGSGSGTMEKSVGTVDFNLDTEVAKSDKPVGDSAAAGKQGDNSEPVSELAAKDLIPAADEKKDAVKAAAEDGEDPELAELVDKPGDMPSGMPPKTGEHPPLTQQSRVSFAEGTAFQRERTLLTSQGTRSHSQASAFDEHTLNMSQFVQTSESFLGELPDMMAFQMMVKYVKEGYMETEDERMSRLMKSRKEQQVAKRKALLSSLFEMWDNDGSGFLDLEEIEAVMRKYKDGMENAAIDDGKKTLKKKASYVDARLSKREFREFVYAVVEHMAGTDSFDFFVDFLLNSVERSYQERVRGEARKKWLQHIITAAERSGASMEPVYKSVFQALYKDAEAHGGGKVISSYISMLERNLSQPQRGDHVLRYVAATVDDAPHVLNKCMYRDSKGVSFAAVESGKPIHVPRVMNHGNVHFWNPDRQEAFKQFLNDGIYEKEKDGSFIVVPLKDRKKRVFGLLGLDTLNDPRPRVIFITHEIQYFQGVAKAFSIAYHYVDVRQKTMRISESAVSWIHRRCTHVHDITVYMVEPEHKTQDFLLRKMITTDHKGQAHINNNPLKMERKDNLFRDYLFKCVDNSESVAADAYGQRHLAFPLRDDEGRTIVVLDISIGAEQKQLPKAENREVIKMLRLLQMAYKEISHESREGDRNTMFAEADQDDDNNVEILFDRLMLNELRENVAKLDATSYAELKSYKEPPKIVHEILKAVLGVFYPSQCEEGVFEDWNKCKAFVNPTLSSKILQFDPTTGTHEDIPVARINASLEQVPHGMVSKHGSIPAQFLYNWVFVCISLIEHSNKMSESKRKEAGQNEDQPVEKKVEEAKAEKPKEVSGEQEKSDESKKPDDTSAETEAPPGEVLEKQEAVTSSQEVKETHAESGAEPVQQTNESR